ncbi:hypothetical protein CWE12_12905 [Aliidiomarina sedimenti]|uniref:Uncharacterized protein n=1 Tax=Aliidiomarina sedimenti TaxID=1933879 RepID=A0ABY0BV78_9GAMM|nr:hypothetical protein [Aliidiomarina sedimenti]RUO28114.1 hypothetical protein CWE12_12905 [Aliidiomarina sedimenti]
MSQQLNVDWSSPEGQAYRNALTAQGLDDATDAATVTSMFTPAGVTTTALGYFSMAALSLLGLHERIGDGAGILEESMNNEGLREEDSDD